MKIEGVNPYYERDGIVLYHGDCRELLPLIPEATVDLVLTDPPYGHHNNNGDLAHHRELALGLVVRRIREAGEARPIANDGPEANDLVRFIFAEAARILVSGGCCCCCCGGGGPDPQFANWSRWLNETVGFKQAVVWDKGGLGMGWHYRRNYEMVLIGQKPGAACKWYGGRNVPNIFRCPRVIPGRDDHPTPKPVALMAHFIGLHSEAGDSVLDPCCGAGTTLIAAWAGHRHGVGIEIDERWCALAAKRLEAAERGISVKELDRGQGTLFDSVREAAAT